MIKNIIKEMLTRQDETVRPSRIYLHDPFPFNRLTPCRPAALAIGASLQGMGLKDFSKFRKLA